MFGIFLIFQLIKCFLQAIFYTIATVVVFTIIDHVRGKGDKPTFVMHKRHIVLEIVVITMSFFLLSFHPFFNEGGGDFARLPIGNGYEIQEIDGSHTFIWHNNRSTSNRIESGQEAIDSFVVRNDVLCAKSTGGYFIVIEMKSGEKEYIDPIEGDSSFNNFATEHNYPTIDKFSDFDTEFRKHWALRNLLLP